MPNMNDWSTFDHMVLLFMKCFVKKKLSMPRLHTATTESRVFFPQNLQKKTSQLSLSTGRFAAETAADFGWNTKSQGTVVMIGYGDVRAKSCRFCYPYHSYTPASFQYLPLRKPVQIFTVLDVFHICVLTHSPWWAWGRARQFFDHSFFMSHG